jgi:hypothetical protein
LGPSVAVHPVDSDARDPAIALRRSKRYCFHRMTFILIERIFLQFY